jgi:hypothetical protein
MLSRETVNEKFGSDNGWYMQGATYWDGWPI